MKTDARVRYTKKVLQEALLKLLEQKPVNKITVKEVCELAQLNRATFYAHYTDCFDLLENIENELLSNFDESLKYIQLFNIEKLVTAMYDIIDRNPEVCRVLVFKQANPTIIRRMIESAHDMSIKYWRTQLKKASDDELEMLYLCLSNGLMYVVVSGYERFDRSKVIRFVNRMFQSSVAPYV